MPTRFSCTLLLLIIFISSTELSSAKARADAFTLKPDTSGVVLLRDSDVYLIQKEFDNSVDFAAEETELARKMLKIEIIDQKLFERKKSTGFNFITTDTSLHKKVNGVITLSSPTKTIKFIDNPLAEEDIQVYNYMGRIDFLNTYIISGMYWESWGC